MIQIISFSWLRILLLTLVLTTTTFAQEQSVPIEANAHRIFSEVLSPFCPGRSLNDCPSPQATELKDEIKKMLVEGKTSDEIFQLLFTRYGEGIRAMPKKEGFGALAWFMPGFFLLLGAGILFTWLGTRREKILESNKGQAPLSPEMQARIQKELSRS